MVTASYILISPMQTTRTICNRCITQKAPRCQPWWWNTWVSLKPFCDTQFDLHINYIKSNLHGKIWFLGKEFSGADIMMSFPLQFALMLVPTGQFPSIERFVAQVESNAFLQISVRTWPLGYFVNSFFKIPSSISNTFNTLSGVTVSYGRYKYSCHFWISTSGNNRASYPDFR